MSSHSFEIKVVLGTMQYGEPADPRKNDGRVVKAEEASEMLSKHAEILRQSGERVIEFDTARLYNGGNTELLLGKLLPGIAEQTAGDSSIAIASKAYATAAEGMRLTGIEIRTQMERSLEALGVASLDIFYLHWPDRTVPLEEQLAAVQALYEEGKFRRFGLSNFAAWEVAEIAMLCREKGYVKPAVYQGMYCALNRNVESELLPCLRHFDIAFYAYNPLAGGLLTGKYLAFEEDPQAGRFAGTTLWGQAYRKRYWKKPVFEALTALNQQCREAQISMAEAALRWLKSHSLLQRERDAIIIGASSLAHLEANLQALQKSEPLPEPVLTAFNDLWFVAKPDAQQYWR